MDTLLILLSIFTCCTCQRLCQVETPDSNVSFLKAASDWCPGDRKWVRKPFRPFRLKWFPLDLPRFSESARRMIGELMDETVDYFKKILLVRRSVQTIGLTEQQALNCEDHGQRICRHKAYGDHIRFSEKCDPSDKGGIPKADFVIYIRESKCSPQGGVLASAFHCEVSFDGRPTFGRMSLCPYHLVTENWNRHALQRVLQHETLHAMGFNTRTGLTDPALQYKDNGTLRSGLLQVSRIWKVNTAYTTMKNVTVVASPITRSFVRHHFNCSTLEGAEIENEGDGGTAFTHWEKRIFGGETLSGYLSRRSYLSELTWAMFEDTGYYKVNYAHADSLTFGKRKGCKFAQGSCREYMDSLGEDNLKPGGAKPYCNWADYVENKKLKSTIRECSNDRQYYSRCDFAEDKDIDKDKTYFADQWSMINGENITGGKLYGGSQVMDGCPHWTEEERVGAGKIADSVCTNTFGQPKPEGNWGAEIFGNESICVKQDGKFEVYECLPLGFTRYQAEKGAHGAGCYRYKCERGRLMIQANYSQKHHNDARSPYWFMQQYKICWAEGSAIRIRRHQFSGEKGKVRYHKGILICPKCKDVCERNKRFPGFKCAKDILLDSTDFSAIPCDQGFSAAISHKRGFDLVLLLVCVLVFVGCKC